MTGATLLVRFLLATTSPDSVPPLTLGEKAAPILMVVGVLLIGVMLVMSIRRRADNAQKNQLFPRDRMQQIKTEARGRDEAHSLQAEMVEAGTRIVAQIDARAERLERLIRHADERLDLLAGSGVPPLAGEESLLNSSAVANPRSGGRATGPSGGQPDQPLKLVSPPAVPPVPPLTQAASAAPKDPLSREVHQLADRGLSALEIAQTLDEQVGKIELILALRATPRSAP